MKNRKNKQKRHFSGKKKYHTLKAQVIADQGNKKIMCTDFCEGKKHDFRLFKESKIMFQERTNVLADSGYQGIQKIHCNVELPKKSSKKRPLTKEEKSTNRDLSSRRVLVENIIGSVKRFRILSERYRNRRKRFGLRFNLIAAIHNFEL